MRPKDRYETGHPPLPELANVEEGKEARKGTKRTATTSTGTHYKDFGDIETGLVIAHK